MIAMFSRLKRLLRKIHRPKNFDEADSTQSRQDVARSIPHAFGSGLGRWRG